VQNIAEVNRQLSDPRFNDPSDPDVARVKASLERVVGQQSKLLNIIFSIAYSERLTDSRFYPDTVQQELVDAVRRSPKGAVTPGDIFGPFAVIANENIAQTQALENTAAAQIVTMAPSCGDHVATSSPSQDSTDYAAPQPTKVDSAVIPPAVRAADITARAFFTSLLQGNIDRSHLSPALDSNLTPSFVETISTQLAALRTPTWGYVGTRTYPSGDALVYRLEYGNGVTLYYSYGADSKGTIFAILIGTRPPPDGTGK
jgi:hypothetical protein